jgi:hypothetical protein
MAIEKEIHNASIKEKVLNLEISNRVEQSKKEAEIYRLRNIELVVLNEEITKQKEEILEQKKRTDEALVESKVCSKAAHPIRENGFSWRAYSGHCT